MELLQSFDSSRSLFSYQLTLQHSDEALSDRVVEDLADRLGFITRDEVVNTFVARKTHAYPVYDLDYRAKLDKIYAFLNLHEGLHIVGRGGTFRYNNADHSVETGLLVAQNLMGEDHDVEAVNAEKEYHEEKRIDGD